MPPLQLWLTISAGLLCKMQISSSVSIHAHQPTVMDQQSSAQAECACRAGQEQVAQEADDKESRIAAAAKAVAMQRSSLPAKAQTRQPVPSSMSGQSQRQTVSVCIMQLICTKSTLTSSISIQKIDSKTFSSKIFGCWLSTATQTDFVTADDLRVQE